MSWCESDDDGGFEVLTVVTMTSTIFRDVMPYSPVEVNRHCLLLTGFFLGLLFGPEEGNNTFLWNFGRRRLLLVIVLWLLFDPEDGGKMFLRNVGRRRFHLADFLLGLLFDPEDGGVMFLETCGLVPIRNVRVFYQRWLVEQRSRMPANRERPYGSWSHHWKMTTVFWPTVNVRLYRERWLGGWSKGLLANRERPCG
jgi:hypothetical protein